MHKILISGFIQLNCLKMCRPKPFSRNDKHLHYTLYQDNYAIGVLEMGKFTFAPIIRFYIIPFVFLYYQNRHLQMVNTNTPIANTHLRNQ